MNTQDAVFRPTLYAFLAALILALALPVSTWAEGPDSAVATRNKSDDQNQPFQVIIGDDARFDAEQMIRALGQGPDGGRTVLGGSYVLRSGEVLNGDLAVIGGSARIEAEAEVRGNVAVLGGSVIVAGRVSGDVTIFGGSVDLRATAVVTGNVVTMGGGIRQAPGAVVEGDIVEGFRFDRDFRFPVFPLRPEAPPTPAEPGVIEIPGIGPVPGLRDWSLLQVRPLELILSTFAGIFGAIVLAVAMAVLGLLAVLFLPRHTRVVMEVGEQNALVSFVVGFLTLVLGVGIVVLLVITICLIPFGALLGLLLLLGGVFGWLAIGWLAGKRILQGLGMQERQPLLEVALGVALITLLSRMPLCIGFLFGLIVGSIGLGAVVLSRFGTQHYENGGSLVPAGGPPPINPPIPQGGPGAAVAPTEASPTPVQPETQVETGQQTRGGEQPPSSSPPAHGG